MFKFTSLSGFLALQLITHCLFSPALTSTTSMTGTLWGSFDGLTPADESTASPMPIRGQCALACQGHAGCQGFFYNDVSKMCVRVTSESDFFQNGSTVSNCRYYTDKYTCPVTTTTNLIDAASSSCYTVHDTHMIWDAARDHCNSTGGQLAVLDTRGKVVFIMNVMQKNETYTSQRYHLGARRPMDQWNTAWPASGQDFVWLNGHPLDLTVAVGYWSHKDPNNEDGKENVIQLYHKPGYSRVLIDGLADQNRDTLGHICQYPLV